ncbi:MAG TPA: hypothetical protein VLE50_03890 [Cellvibrio sp.]|nr:hypothetical protein [Cellvibrio sp.]
MKAIAPSHFYQQSGMSLISLLIGLLISVLCILGSLTLYKNLIHVATETKLDSNHDGQLASAMLMIQLEVQSAGFGIDGAGVEHIIKHIPTTGERQLLWRFTTDGTTYQCRGLFEQGEEQGLYRKLSLIKVNAGCDAATPLNNLTWDTANPVTVLGKWRVVDDGVTDIGLDDYVADHDTMVNFELTPTACNPYGANGAVTDNRILLTITVPGSAYLQGAADMTPTEYQYCLPNIYPAASP